MNERVELVKKCLYAYGQAIRGDWGNIDGREVRDDLEGIAWLLEEESDLPTFEEWLASAYIKDKGNNCYGWI